MSRRRPRVELTTLQLAGAIADAVLDAWVRGYTRRRRDLTKDAPTQAVLATLHAEDAWFCRHPNGGYLSELVAMETLRPLTDNRVLACGCKVFVDNSRILCAEHR